MPGTELNAEIVSACLTKTAELNLTNFKLLVDDVVAKTMSNILDHVNGHAIAIWLKENGAEEKLTIACNVGDKGASVEGLVSQPLSAGLVSKAYRDGQVVCHQGLFKHREQSLSVDKALNQITAHQIASPFRLFGNRVGAVTVVQTLAKGIEQHSEWGFTKEDISHFETGVEILQRLIELNLIRGI